MHVVVIIFIKKYLICFDTIFTYYNNSKKNHTFHNNHAYIYFEFYLVLLLHEILFYSFIFVWNYIISFNI